MRNFVQILILGVVLSLALCDASRPTYHFDFFPSHGTAPQLELSNNMSPDYEIPHPGFRTLHGSTVDQNGLLWILGGWERPCDMWSWSWKTHAWCVHEPLVTDASHHGALDKMDSPNVPGRRFFHTISAMPGSRILLVFGFGLPVVDHPVQYEDEFLGDVWEYSTSEEVWRYRSIYPGSEEDTNTQDSFSNPIHPSARGGHAMWLLDESLLFVFGGNSYTADGILYGADTEYMWVFSDLSGSWSFRRNETSQFPWPATRRACWKRETHGDVLFYIYGGRNSSDPEFKDMMSTLHRYRVSTSYWEEVIVSGQTPGRRGGSSAVFLESSKTGNFKGGYALILGGGTPTWHYYADVWRFEDENLDHPTFHRLPLTIDGAELEVNASGRMDEDPYWTARDLMSVEQIDRWVVLFGGWFVSGQKADVWAMQLPCEADSLCDFTCKNGDLSSDDATCSRFGHCLVPGGNCICLPGHFGENCQDWVCEDGILHSDVVLSCGGHGTCASAADSSCRCTWPWGGELCRSWHTISYIEVVGGGSVLCVTFAAALITIVLLSRAALRRNLDSRRRRSINLDLPRRGPAGEVPSYILRGWWHCIVFDKHGQIGAGGQGVVVRATYKFSELGNAKLVVAVKKFLVRRQKNLGEKSERKSSSDQLLPTRKEFEREIEAMSQIKHPHVVSFYGAFFAEVEGEKDLCANIVMEYCDGGTLKELMDARQPLSFSRKIDILYQVSLGMEAIHAAGLAHRDLASDNVMFRDSCVKIVDFGFSVKFTALKSKTNPAGKVRYMPPSYKGDKTKIDVWSFGVLCWEVWTGKMAFAEHAFDQRILQHRIVSHGLRLNITKCVGMPRELKDLIVRCWREDANERPSFADTTAILERHKQVLFGSDEVANVMFAEKNPRIEGNSEATDSLASHRSE